MYKKLLVIGLACLMSLSVITNTSHAQERISGPWLWMIALTELNQGGQASTDIDSLNEASKGRTSEEQIAKMARTKVIRSAVIDGHPVNFLRTEISTQCSLTSV